MEGSLGTKIESPSRQEIEVAEARLKELFWDDHGLIEITKAAKNLSQRAEKEEMRAGLERQIGQLEQKSLELLAERKKLNKLLGKPEQS